MGPLHAMPGVVELGVVWYINIQSMDSFREVGVRGGGEKLTMMSESL